jgi:hypothetical protein
MTPHSDRRELDRQFDPADWQQQLREFCAVASCLPELFEAEENSAPAPPMVESTEAEVRLRALRDRLASMAAWHEAKSAMLRHAAELLATQGAATQ